MQLVSKISNLCDPDPPTLQTDGRTDGRHAISIPRYALVHRAVIKRILFAFVLCVEQNEINGKLCLLFTVHLRSISLHCQFHHLAKADIDAQYLFMDREA